LFKIAPLIRSFAGKQCEGFIDKSHGIFEKKLGDCQRYYQINARATKNIMEIQANIYFVRVSNLDKLNLSISY